MTLDDVRRLIEPEREALRARGVSALYVFGSVARGEAGVDSDVDVFIEVEPDTRFSIIDLVAVKHQLSGALRSEADVHMRKGLHWRIRDTVFAEAVQVL